MTTLHALKHVAAAVHHGEVLADEAEDLHELPMAARLRHRSADLAAKLEDAVGSLDLVEPARLARARAHAVLEAVYQETSLTLQTLLGDGAGRLTPGGHVDVSERVRFRLRHLPTEHRAVVEVRTALERALFAYDHALDEYLFSCGAAQTLKDRVIVESQAFRVELERVKQRLLLVADAGSEVWRRIKRRRVRTKRARWINEAHAQGLLASAVASFVQAEPPPP